MADTLFTSTIATLRIVEITNIHLFMIHNGLNAYIVHFLNFKRKISNETSIYGVVFI